MAFPKSVSEAHPRRFPDAAFLPSPLRPLNPEVFAATFLNVMFGTQEIPVHPNKVRAAIESDVLQGDTESIKAALAVLDDTLLPKSKSYAGNAQSVVRVSHPLVGKNFTPSDHYGAPHWAKAFLEGTGIRPEVLDDLRELGERAARRPLNLLEEAVQAAMAGLRGADKAPKPANSAEGAPPRLAIPEVASSFQTLLEDYLGTGRAKLHDLDFDEAEQMLFDVVRCYEIHVWVYWVQMHLSAHRAVMAIREDEQIVTGICPIYFGYATERHDTRGRPFAQERARIEQELYSGSLALMALANVHIALDVAQPFWFNEIDGMRSGNQEEASDSLVSWLRKYVDLVKEEKNRDLETPVPDRMTPRQAIDQYHRAVAEYYLDLPNNQRMPYTTTYGVFRSLGQSDACPLIFGLGPGRGLTMMVDADIVLLFGRLIARGEKRVRLDLILDRLGSLGLVLDETTREFIVDDLEQKGLIKSLSDSGEAIYVSVD